MTSGSLPVSAYNPMRSFVDSPVSITIIDKNRQQWNCGRPIHFTSEDIDLPETYRLLCRFEKFFPASSVLKLPDDYRRYVDLREIWNRRDLEGLEGESS